MRTRSPRRLALGAAAVLATVLAATLLAVLGGRMLGTAPPLAGDLAPVGATELATVVRVVDGDTLVVDRGQGDERLRYIGIDTPEHVTPGVPDEPLGRRATRANAELVEGREVHLERDVSEHDRFGRLLRYVWLRQGDGWLLVNLELVRQGLAEVTPYPPDVRRVPELRVAERAAREAGLGRWGDGATLP